MKTRQLPSQQRLRELLDYNPETGVLTWRPRGIPNWDGKCAGREAFTAITPKGYRRGLIDGVQFRAHRVAYKWYHDDEPEEIDHINGVRDDNRIANLRPSTRRENMLNSVRAKRRARLGENDVKRTKADGWEAKISYEGSNRFLGTYDNKEQAQAAVAGALAFIKSLNSS